MKTFRTLLKVELKLSLRGLDMFIFAICMPVVVMVLLGIIYGSKPAFEGAEYSFLAQSFPAVSSIAICAGGLMGLPLILSDYREKKILKKFKVTPISPGMLLFVQLVIYAIYSVVSLLFVFLIARIFFKVELMGSVIQFLGSFLLVMLSMFSIGLLVGGVAPNSKIAGMIASLLYFPMIIFSGATLPFEAMPKALQNVVEILPLTQGIKLLKCASLGLPMENVGLPILLITGIFGICSLLALKLFKWE